MGSDRHTGAVPRVSKRQKSPIILTGKWWWDRFCWSATSISPFSSATSCANLQQRVPCHNVLSDHVETARLGLTILKHLIPSSRV